MKLVCNISPFNTHRIPPSIRPWALSWDWIKMRGGRLYVMRSYQIRGTALSHGKLWLYCIFFLWYVPDMGTTSFVCTLEVKFSRPHSVHMIWWCLASTHIRSGSRKKMLIWQVFDQIYQNIYLNNDQNQADTLEGWALVEDLPKMGGWADALVWADGWANMVYNIETNVLLNCFDKRPLQEMGINS